MAQRLSGILAARTASAVVPPGPGAGGFATRRRRFHPGLPPADGTRLPRRGMGM